MKLPRSKIKSINNEIFIKLYEWSIFLADQERKSEFHVLKSLQSSYVDLQTRRILQLKTNHQQEVLEAFIKRAYQRRGFIKFKLSQHEQALIELIENPHQKEIANWNKNPNQDYPLYPDDFYVIEKNADYKQKKQLGKKVTTRTLFSKAKKNLSKDKCLSLDSSNDSAHYVSSFNTEISKDVKLVTFVNSDSHYGDCYYSYYHDIYVYNNRMSLFLSYPALINFPPNWFIYHEDDIEVALDTIWSCCQQMTPKITEVVNNLKL